MVWYGTVPPLWYHTNIVRYSMIVPVVVANSGDEVRTPAKALDARRFPLLSYSLDGWLPWYGTTVSYGGTNHTAPPSSHGLLTALI